jgi:UDP-3-O-[3-hydroxymyristoyl] glucosamine N-acyltransferase LpxD
MSEQSVSRIAEFLETNFVGRDFLINGACSSTNPRQNKIAFINNVELVDTEIFNSTGTLFLVREVPEKFGECAFIVVDNPRLAFARISSLLAPNSLTSGIHELALVHPNAHIGENVSVGPFSVIHENTFVGDNVIIENGVTIGESVRVGNSVRIKSNSVIGTDGFGFEYSEENIPTRIHHLGGVSIEDNVEIGCNTVICRGTIDDTVISSDVKIDDHVFIAHNVFIGRRSMIIAGTEISGSVSIGDDCWIAPQVTILNKISIGSGAVVGIGSVVIRDVEAGATVVGNPAKPLRKGE